MASARTHRWRLAWYVVSLSGVIVAALIWTSYSTFRHAVEAGVPDSVAWTLFVVLDGTVAVTTPIWLSTVLPVGVRNWGGVIGLLALGGSMAVNIDQWGWIGGPAPLLAGLLIHVMGLVLRAYHDHDEARDVGRPSLPGPSVEPAVASVPEVERVTLGVGSDQAQPEERKLPAEPPAEATPLMLKVVSSSPEPDDEPLDARMPAGLDPRDIVFWLLDEAVERRLPLPSGPELTAAVRAEGHEINDFYGRTTRARWKKAREEVTA